MNYELHICICAEFAKTTCEHTKHAKSQSQIAGNLEHVAAFVLQQSLLVIGRLAAPVGLEAGSGFLNAQQALSLLIHKAAADSLHVGQVHTH